VNYSDVISTLYTNLQNASATSHIALLGVGGTIFNIHTLEHFRKLGLDPHRVKTAYFQVPCAFYQLCCYTCPYQAHPFQNRY
jgi:hypothetical protein